MRSCTLLSNASMSVFKACYYYAVSASRAASSSHRIAAACSLVHSEMQAVPTTHLLFENEWCCSQVSNDDHMDRNCGQLKDAALAMQVRRGVILPSYSCHVFFCGARIAGCIRATRLLNRRTRTGMVESTVGLTNKWSHYDDGSCRLHRRLLKRECTSRYIT